MINPVKITAGGEFRPAPKFDVNEKFRVTLNPSSSLGNIRPRGFKKGHHRRKKAKRRLLLSSHSDTLCY